MTILKHELRQGRISFAVWTCSIALLMMACVLIYPEFHSEAESVSQLFASMGSFTSAFGMDRLNIGTLSGYYAIECGNILLLGGALYASLTASSVLSKEEAGRTAEFLLVHPLSRAHVLAEKLAAVLLQILALNGIVFALSVLAVFLTGEEIPWKNLLLLHGSALLLQAELAGICFGVSSALSRSSTGIGMGLSILLYALNLIANMTDKVKFLKVLTPFAYCEGAELISQGHMDAGLVLWGMLLGAAGIAAAFLWYRRKDIL